MRKPSQDPTKPCKLKGKNFRVGEDRGYFEVRRVDHPFLKGIYQGPGGIEEARWELEDRKAKFRSLVGRQEWGECLEMLQPKLRLKYLLDIRRHLDDVEFFNLLRMILTQSTSLRAYRYPLRQLFRRTDWLTYWTHMMAEPEIQLFLKLPDPVTIWRGSGEPGLGWAWALNQDVAREYAKTYLKRTPNQQGFLLKGLVRKDHIIGLFSDHPTGHETVFVNPEGIRLLGTALMGSGVQPLPPSHPE